jgi:hypothetical protein
MLFQFQRITPAFTLTYHRPQKSLVCTMTPAASAHSHWTTLTFTLYHIVMRAMSMSMWLHPLPTYYSYVQYAFPMGLIDRPK